KTELAAVRELDEANRRDRRVDFARGELVSHMTIVTLGHEIAFVGIPGELFVELGLALKSNPYFHHTFVFGYSNDLVGYIPTREAYAQGGYEVATARVAQGTGELILQEALAHLHEIRQQIDAGDKERVIN